MTSDRTQPSLAPSRDVAGAAGYAASGATTDGTKVAVHKYLNDPLVLSQLTERVYELLLEDMRSEREKVRNYDGGRWI